MGGRSNERLNKQRFQFSTLNTMLEWSSSSNGTSNPFSSSKHYPSRSEREQSSSGASQKSLPPQNYSVGYMGNPGVARGSSSPLSTAHLPPHILRYTPITDQGNTASKSLHGFAGRIKVVDNNASFVATQAKADTGEGTRRDVWYDARDRIFPNDEEATMSRARKRYLKTLSNVSRPLNSSSCDNLQIAIPSSRELSTDLSTYMNTCLSQLGLSPLPQKRECKVCDECLELSRFPASKLSETCDHENEVCMTCLSTMVATDIQHKDCDQLQCPLCAGALSYETIRAVVDRKVFELYDAKVMAKWVKSQPNWWECPKANCGFAGLHESGAERPLLTCGNAKCGYKACFVCKTPWHTGFTCQQYKAHKTRASQEEKASRALVQRISKECPKCGSRIQKIGGCDHMTCKLCKNEWCWKCNCDWSLVRQLGNTAHQVSCPYHSNNLS